MWDIEFSFTKLWMIEETKFHDLSRNNKRHKNCWDKIITNCRALSHTTRLDELAFMIYGQQQSRNYKAYGCVNCSSSSKKLQFGCELKWMISLNLWDV